MTVILWGIPSCGTVKKARLALQQAGVAFVDRDLRQQPPTTDDAARFIAAVGVGPLKNTSGGSYRALPDDTDGWSDARWAQAFASDPMLIKRPVIEADGVVVGVGWKTDALLSTLR